jgi:hypothetical protein
VEYWSGLVLAKTLPIPVYGCCSITTIPGADSLTSLTQIDARKVPNHSLKVQGRYVDSRQEQVDVAPREGGTSEPTPDPPPGMVLHLLGGVRPPPRMVLHVGEGVRPPSPHDAACISKKSATFSPFPRCHETVFMVTRLF